MAEIRCPLCDRANSIESEFCQFCGARLRAPSPLEEKDTIIRPGEEPVRKPTSEFERVSPSLRASRPLQPGEEPTKRDTAELEQVLPAWLRAARKVGEEPSETKTPESSSSFAAEKTPGEGLPPWLADLEREQSSEEPEVPDWLAGLAVQQEQEEEVPDWLASLRGAGMGGEPLDREELPPKSAEITLSFEEAIPSDQAGREAVFPPSEEEGREETPAVFAGEEIPAAAGEIPDWLASLQGAGEADAPAAFVGEEMPVTSVEAGETPDWLSSLQEGGAGETPVMVTGEGMPVSAEETPEWLAFVQEEGDAESKTAFVGEEIPATAEEAGEIPDWLTSLQGEGELPAVFAAEEAAAPGEMPSWLGAAFGEGEGATPPFVEEEESALPEVPAWLKTPGSETAEIPAEPSMPEPTPSWLIGVESEEKEKTPPGVPPLIAEEGEIESPAGFSIEAPDWLSALKPEGAALESGEALAEEIAPAELPDWVQAMRPLEAAVAEAASAVLEETPLETTGLLAGLRGVLPPVGGLTPTRKPMAPPVKLQVTEHYQALATQLEEMVAAEESPRAVAGEKLISLPSFWRWLLAAILLMVTFLPIVIGLPASQALTPASQYVLMQLVDQIPANSPVVVVFDYEPALSGELESAAAPLLDHLILVSAARLTFVSTSPTGPILAERFMQSVEAHHRYQNGQHYVNLGYLPGGASGVLAFASNPRSAGAATLWQSPLLADVRSLQDYAALIVLTDSADVGRIWIEQSRPYLGDRPLILVISAQAEPLIQPYYDAGQIQGLVIGLAGGKAYAQALPAPGVTLGENYWSSFGVGLFTAAVLIAVGGAWSAFSAWSERPRTPRKGGG